MAVATGNFRSIGRGVAPSEPGHGEGFLAKAIEEQTSKLPSDLFLWAATGSIAASGIAVRDGMKSVPPLGIVEQHGVASPESGGRRRAEGLT